MATSMRIIRLNGSSNLQRQGIEINHWLDLNHLLEVFNSLQLSDFRCLLVVCFSFIFSLFFLLRLLKFE